MINASRLASFFILLLLITPIATLGIFIPFLIEPENIPAQIPLLLTSLICFILLVVIYVLGRFLHYQVSIIVAIVIGLSAVLTVASIGHPPNNLIALYYVLIIIMVSSLFLSPKYALFVYGRFPPGHAHHPPLPSAIAFTIS